MSYFESNSAQAKKERHEKHLKFVAGAAERMKAQKARLAALDKLSGKAAKGNFHELLEKSAKEDNYKKIKGRSLND